MIASFLASSEALSRVFKLKPVSGLIWRNFPPLEEQQTTLVSLFPPYFLSVDGKDDFCEVYSGDFGSLKYFGETDKPVVLFLSDARSVWTLGL